MNYWFACARGYLEGMERGLYKRTEWAVNTKCLGSDAVADAVALYNMIDDGDEFINFGKFFNLLF